VSIAKLVQELAVYTSDGDRMGAPLLVQLQEAMLANVGRTKGGASSQSERIGFDADTYELREDITGRIATLFHQVTELKPSRSARFNLLAWANEFTAAEEWGEITEAQRQVAEEALTHMVRRIRRHFDRPVMTEITAPCPRCGVRWVVKGTGEQQVRTSTLWSTVETGQEIVIDCANCEASWVGDDQVERLGGLLGIRLDWDAIRVAQAPVVEANELEEVS